MPHSNKYAPPEAHVADAPRIPELASRPKQVRVAVALLWADLALGIPASVLSAMRDPEGSMEAVALTFTALFFALNVFLNIMVYRGKNWARIVTLVLVVLASVLILVPFSDPNPPGPVEKGITVFALALEVVAMVLLFTRPGSLWFRTKEQ